MCASGYNCNRLSFDSLRQLAAKYLSLVVKKKKKWKLGVGIFWGCLENLGPQKLQNQWVTMCTCMWERQAQIPNLLEDTWTTIPLGKEEMPIAPLFSSSSHVLQGKGIAKCSTQRENSKLWTLGERSLQPKLNHQAPQHFLPANKMFWLLWTPFLNADSPHALYLSGTQGYTRSPGS